MSKDYDDYQLYSANSELCLDKQEYDSVVEVKEELRLIPNVFEGNFVCFDNSTFDHEYSDLTIIKKILNCKPRLFLHEAKDNNSLSLAYFFYDNYLVLAGVGPTSSTTSTPGMPSVHNYKYTKSNVKPIIIPYSSIKDVSQEKKNHYGNDYKWILTIEYKNGRKSFIELFRMKGVSIWTNKKRLVSCNSWTIPVNKKLFAFSTEPSQGDYVAQMFASKISALISTSRDISNIEEKLFKYFDSDCAYQLFKYRYVPQMFVTTVLQNINKTNSDDIKERAKTLKKKLSELKIKKQEVSDEIETLESNVEVAGFFQKGKLKKELKTAKEQQETIERTIKQELHKFEDYIYNSLKSNEKTKSYDDENSQNEIDFYTECNNKKITDPTNDEQKIIFEMLSKKFNYNNFDSAFEAYKNGKTKYQYMNSDKESRNKYSNRTKYIIQYNKEKDIADVEGYEKYLKTAKKEYEIASNYAKAAGILSQYATLNSNQKAYKSDSAILGGLASGIAGPAAGIMTAAKTEVDNAQRKAAVEKSNALHKKYAQDASAFENAYSSQAGSYNYTINGIYKKMIDGSYKEKYLDYLKCSVKDIKRLDKDILELSVHIEQIKSVSINGIKFIIDGSIELEIYDDNKKIGNSIINAPGYDNTDLSEVGFNHQKEYTAIGLINKETDISNLSFKFKPYHIWIIEK